MDYILGIDLGTSNTVVFVNEGNKRTKVVKFDGENSFPTLVGKAKSGEWLFGRAALDRTKKSFSLEKSIKRFIGTDEKISLGGEKYTAFMLYREFFKYIKDNFKKQYPNAEKITAIVTYPVKFSQSQITDTVKSAQEVFDVVFCLTEPLAATIPYVDTYRNSKKSKAPEKETLMIIDLGGGTLDINFVEIDGKKIKRLDEIPQTGDLKVGGDVWDDLFLKHILERLKNEQYNEQWDNELEDYQKKYFLITYIRTLKEELSNCDAKKLYDCNPFAFEDFEITREEFEQSTSKIFDKFQKILIKSKEEIEKFGFKIDKIILAGGASQMPRITEIANDVFEGSLILDKDALLDPFESIAKGASLYLDYKEWITNGLTRNIGILLDSKNPNAKPGTKKIKIIVKAGEKLPIKERVYFFRIAESSEANRVYIEVVKADTTPNIYTTSNGILKDELLIVDTCEPEFLIKSSFEIDKDFQSSLSDEKIDDINTRGRIKITVNVNEDGVIDITVSDRLTAHSQKFVQKTNDKI